MKAATETLAVDLSVDVLGKRPRASLTFVNGTAHNVFLEKVNACVSGKIENDVFQITSNGVPLRYVGMLAKRNPPGPQDFVKIVPGQKLISVVFLDDAYEFLQGQHSYTARYSALHDYPDKPDYFELSSEDFTFTLSR